MLLVTLFPPRWYAARLGGPWIEARGPTLIVLGGDGPNGRMLGRVSYWRSVYAVLTWRDGGFKHMIISGAEPVTGPMRDFIVCQGVPPESIMIEGRSTSTRENALYTANLARRFPGPYVLLTSDYHMWRASRAFRKAGLDVLPQQFPDAIKRFNDWTQRWSVFETLVVESGKIAYYKARGWI